MRCGISTACFFPEDTLDALKQVVETGSPVTEIFLNTYGELKESYVCRLEEEIRSSGIEVLSLHPFTSMLEGFFFASRYKTRFDDGIELYRQYYELCQRLGVRLLVFHGDHKTYNPFPLNEYVDNYRRLAAVGLEYGVQLCHENVFYCRLGTPDNIRAFHNLAGDEARFVLDIKQMLRAGAGVEEMLGAMGDGIRHVHISDHSPGSDCLPPGTGDFDYPGFVAALRQMRYPGDLIIELYHDSYQSVREIADSMDHMNHLLHNTAILQQ